MPSNFPGPYELRFIYDATTALGTYDHEFRLSLDLDTVGEPGDAFSAFTAVRRNTSPIALHTLAEAVLAEVVELFKTDANFTRVDLWNYPSASFVANFITSYAVVTNTAGLHASTPSAYRQDIFTFRTTAGGVAKLDLRHTVSTYLDKTAYPTGNALIDPVIAYLAGANTPFIGRDNGYLFSPLNALGGNNEHIFKSIHR